MEKSDLSKAEKFELMVSQVISLLEGENANVSWNEKILDPDNPSQTRQIDVLVIKDDLMTLIECRLHKQRQNVKWIEELIGRQTSLRAHSIIGVSSSGFTKGAVVKANKFGINLRTVDELTADEIITWGSPIKFSLFYWKPVDLKLDFYFENSALNHLNIPTVMEAFKVHPYFHSVMTAHLKFEDISGMKIREKTDIPFHFHGSFIIENFILCGVLVKKIHSDCHATLEEIPLSIPQVLLYKEPSNPIQGTYIQNFNLGETRVIHNGKNVSINLDISKLDLPPLCQFQFVDFHSDETVDIECFELMGAAESMKIKPGPFTITLNSIKN
ncbi:MAG: restriction endonuclease [Legionella sp.]|nr:restriction endonuclease [Legionella sp.]